MVAPPGPGDGVLVAVGDAEEGIPIRDLVEELVASAHGATAHRQGSPCAWLAFTAEGGADGGAVDLVKLLLRLGIGHERMLLAMRSWEDSRRPVAVVHWIPARVVRPS